MGQGASQPAADSSAGWFSDICDHHPDGMLVADDQALIVYVNERAAAMVGTSVPELLGQDIRKAIPFQEYDGRSWWDRTDPWNGLAIRSGHREKLLIVPGMHEVLVTAKYLRPEGLNVYDIMNHETLVLSKATVDYLTERLKPSDKATERAAAKAKASPKTAKAPAKTKIMGGAA